MYINNLTYSFRIKTKSILQNYSIKYFDIFVVNDKNFEQFFLF